MLLKSFYSISYNGVLLYGAILIIVFFVEVAILSYISLCFIAVKCYIMS